MKRMLGVLATATIAVGMTGLTALSAQAGTGNPPIDDDVVAGDFVAHDYLKYDGGKGDGFESAQKSSIEGPQSAILERPDKANAGTSVEAGSIDLALADLTDGDDEGPSQRRTATVSYDVNGLGDEFDEDKVLRFFVKVDGKTYHSHDKYGSHEDGVATVVLPNAGGPITGVGVVHDSSGITGGVVTVGGIEIDGTTVLYHHLEATTEAPTLTQPTCEGSHMALLTVPTVEGVVYSHADRDVWEVDSARTVTVTATAAPGYVIDGDTEWVFKAEAPLTEEDCTDDQPGDEGGGDDNGKEPEPEPDPTDEPGDDAGKDPKPGDDKGTGDDAGDDKGTGDDTGKDDGSKDDDDDGVGLPDTGAGVNIGLAIGTLALLAGGATLMIRHRRNAAASLNG